MPRLPALTALLTAQLALACYGHAKQPGLDGSGAEIMSDGSGEPQAPGGELRIRLTFAGKAAVVKLRDNPTSRDLLARLPLKLTLSDYAGTEKVAQLPQKLSTRDAPSGFDPSVGDVTYYAPWGNLAIFYRDFGHAKGLVPLGAVESGLKELQALDRDVTVVVERAESGDGRQGSAHLPQLDT